MTWGSLAASARHRLVRDNLVGVFKLLLVGRSCALMPFCPVSPRSLQGSSGYFYHAPLLFGARVHVVVLTLDFAFSPGWRGTCPPGSMFGKRKADDVAAGWGRVRGDKGR